MKKRTTFLISAALLLIGTLLPLSWFHSLSGAYLARTVSVVIANIFFMFAVSNRNGRNPLSNNNELLLLVLILVVIAWILFPLCCIDYRYPFFTLYKMSTHFLYRLSIVMNISFVFLALICVFDTYDKRHSLPS